MRKALVFLGLACLAAGLAQAQTPQVKLMWEQKVDSTIRYKFGYIKFDEKLGEPRLTVSFLWTPPIAFDSLGRVGRLPPLRLATPKVDSGWVAYVSPDSNRMVAVRGASGSDWFLNDLLTINGQYYTRLIFYDRRGRVVGWKDAPSLSAIKMSPYQDRVYAVIGPNKYTPGEYRSNTILLCLDRDGKELWRKSESPQYMNHMDCAEDGTLFIVEYASHSSNDLWGRFYDKDGRIVGQVLLKDVQFASGHTVVAREGQYAALHFINPHVFYFLSRASSQPLWKLSGYEISKEFDVSPDGRYVAITAAKEGASMALIFNRKGEIVWREPGGWFGPQFFKRNFFLISAFERKSFRLYRITD